MRSVLLPVTNPGSTTDYASGTGEVGKGVAGRAGAGAAIGGGLGLIAGLMSLAIPGFGPVHRRRPDRGGAHRGRYRSRSRWIDRRV